MKKIGFVLIVLAFVCACSVPSSFGFSCVIISVRFERADGFVAGA